MFIKQKLLYLEIEVWWKRQKNGCMKTRILILLTSLPILEFYWNLMANFSRFKNNLLYRAIRHFSPCAQMYPNLCLIIALLFHCLILMSSVYLIILVKFGETIKVPSLKKCISTFWKMYLVLKNYIKLFNIFWMWTITFKDN